MLEHETMTPQHLFKLPVELVVETAQYLARWASSSVGGPGGPGGPLSPHQTGQREHRPTYCTKRTRQWKEYRHLVDSDGDNLLHRAVKRSRPIADIAFLLDEELDVNHRNGQGRTPLAVAIAIKNSARIKKPDIVELLLQREQRPTFQTTGPDILCIERLSTRKHGLICGGDNNSTALTWAVRGGKLEAVRLLLGYRAKKQLELSGKDAFYWVVHDGREPIRCPLGRCRSSGPRDRSPSTYPIPYGNLSRTSSDCLTAGRRRSRRPSEGILGSLGAVTRCRSRTRGECEMAHRSKG
ncbi:Ankyrin repeat protein [Aspergillus fumigatus A1163]|uniref:Ankyrin repeat protein n=1 Tax=Aspergillus fumigatus (strain CBS 144.89 / FGSC A1163 / CEA10) TaxID=451804 RepID=B0Y1B2_ASPFC|nr:Ankyrin repeat protein [Aspergillus fumigatus A1163]